jgi:hypothetical protein
MVLALQPIWVMVGLCFAVVSWRVPLPFLFFANPAHRLPAPAGTEWRCSRWLIDWFAGPTLAGFSICPRCKSILAQEAEHMDIRAAEVLAHLGG